MGTLRTHSPSRNLGIEIELRFTFPIILGNGPSRPFVSEVPFPTSSADTGISADEALASSGFLADDGSHTGRFGRGEAFAGRGQRPHDVPKRHQFWESS